ncbi:helix-turn-helix domain-containing protein [uncultured Pseudacidovorax sp.]|uniref:helix-turn-helix domain-containing protein n=1 Tax=uncultured Pseudacidovorax sp. TaxID=679313 RepID=UPI0025D67D4E|nr:helix-turn-helix domain-containing protein [uncultured Pseudacidovorax sp.]
MNRSIHHFQDLHAHAASVTQWRQLYSQLTAGALDSSLQQLSSERCHVFRERINQRVVQQGEAPAGRVCFAVPIAVPGSVRMQGRDADAHSLFFLRGGEEFMFHMPTGMDMLSVTFDRDFFDTALRDTPCADEVAQLLRQPVIKVPAPRFAECRQRLLAMFCEALANDELSGTPARQDELEQAMLDELLRLVLDPGCDRRQRSASSTQDFIVEKCHRLAMTDTVTAPTVMNLCERLQVSRRTVQNSFRAVADTTPLHYLRSVRLNGVRRALTASRACDLSVGDAAAQWGFFHLSHFAAEYQALFGELPSQTPRAARWGHDA